MKKLGVVIDSFSGISKKEAKEAGFYYLPLQVDLDGKVFLDGIDYNFSDAISLIKNSKISKTSLPPTSIIEEILEDALKKYENIIFLPVSSGLSGTYNLIKLKTEKLENVHTINNTLTGTLFLELAKKITKMAENDKSIQEIINYVNEFSEKVITYVIPKNLNALIKGGRLTGAKKYLLTTLKFIPIIQFKNKNTVTGLKRSFRKAVDKSIDKIMKFINDKSNMSNYELRIIHTSDPETLQIAKNVIENRNLKITNINIAGAGVVVHTGYGSIAISVSPKIEN